MKYLTTFASLLFYCTVSIAQSGYKHVNMDVGINIEGHNIYTLALEFNKGTYSAWEVLAEAHITTETVPGVTTGGNIGLANVDNTDLEKKEYLYLLGAYYKPLMFKKRNLLMHFRYGLSAGRTTNFVIGAGAGFELTYHLPSLFAVYIKQSNRYIINIDDRFRHSVHAGIKIPL